VVQGDVPQQDRVRVYVHPPGRQAALDKANHYRYAKDTSPLRAGTNRYPNDKTISKVPAGVKLKISGTIGDWSRATYHGKTGFVFKTHLVINQP
jgi:hypothetical protein